MIRHRGPRALRLLSPSLLTLLALSASAPPAAAQTTEWIADVLRHQAQWVWFLATFAVGLALNLTPCVYPMIPVTLAFFSGQASGRPGYTARLAVLYVLGMSITYATLGLIAARTGMLFGSWFQQPLLLIAAATLMVILALSMFGLYELRPPSWIAQRLGQASSGSVGALGMGMTVGFIATPCIGPLMLGLLVFVSELQRPLLGFFLFFTMGLGMGLPYLLLGFVANQTGRWPKAGAWLVWVKELLGVALLGLSLYFLRPLLPPAIFRSVCVVGLAAAGVYLGWLHRPPLGAGSSSTGRFARIQRATGIALMLLAVAVVPWPRLSTRGRASSATAITWQPYSQARLEAATQAHRPVVIDVAADWCVPCLELDRVTFHHPSVAQRLSDLVTLRVDATRDVPPDAQALFDRYEIIGVPTVLMFNAQGRERPDLRTTGFVPPKAFLAKLEQLTSSQ